MSNTRKSSAKVGSQWFRWDPHIHTPRTLFANGYGDDWDTYLDKLETAVPAPAALGITDYFTLRSYKRIVDYRKAGRLANIPFCFPNIEFRLTVQTRKAAGLNFHILVNPADPDHVGQAENLLASLEYSYQNSTFRCTDQSLISLGRRFLGDPNLPEEKALTEGGQQFKVSLEQLRKVKLDRWVQNNVLFAVSGGADGIGGIEKDSSFAAERENIVELADVIFSGSPRDRTYWGGLAHPDPKRPIRPCLHGSDAHGFDRILKPAEDRLCWIRSRSCFEGLKQILAEPIRRVHIGPEPPGCLSPHTSIARLEVTGGQWFGNGQIHLNDGLVTIIGAKGSGKTALADLIAFAAYAEESQPSSASFLSKAAKLINGTTVKLVWRDDRVDSSTYPRESEDGRMPLVRYLSQQFVERLCSSEGPTKELVEEIEKVVFVSIAPHNRLGCTSFAELRAFRLEAIQRHLEADRRQITALTATIAMDSAKNAAIPQERKGLEDLQRKRVSLEAELKALPASKDDTIEKAYQEVVQAIQSLNDRLERVQRRAALLGNLLQEVVRATSAALQERERQQAEYGDLVPDEVWHLLTLRPDPTAIEKVRDIQRSFEEKAQNLKEFGTEHQPAQTDDLSGPACGLRSLGERQEKLKGQLGTVDGKLKQRAAVLHKLAKVGKEEETASARIKDCERATERIAAAQAARLNLYENVFDNLVNEEQVCAELYSPLQQDLAKGGKIACFVYRRVDLAKWASAGEKLFDLRKPPFNNVQLAKAAEELLLKPWKEGRPDEVARAMGDFLAKYGNVAVKGLAAGVKVEEFGRWLFSTDHIKVEYGLHYEDVPLELLSPGTRGVVLLTLFLTLDLHDDRPLVIDQPEENLDPNTVFSELVPYFRKAAERRQVIVVTHNANLVVNTDSDQVIVASSERKEAGALPSLVYIADGLEESKIREKVCSILEGGTEAFRRRALRYSIGVND